MCLEQPLSRYHTDLFRCSRTDITTELVPFENPLYSGFWGLPVATPLIPIVPVVPRTVKGHVVSAFTDLTLLIVFT